MSLLDSLISYWKLDEASGNALDAHGSNDLTDNNTVGTAAGKVGNARDFEANNSESFSHADNASLSTGNIDFTFSAWVNPETTTGFPTILAKWEDANPNTEFLLLLIGGAFKWIVGPNAMLVTSSVTPTTGNWYFVVVWYDSSNEEIGISVNGTVNTTSLVGGINDGNLPFEIGANAIQSIYWDGLIDEVGFWKRLLTPQERDDLYNNGDGLAYPLSTVSISIAPTTAYITRSVTLTVTGTGTTWLSDPPDFEASAGSIGSVTVLSDTSATIEYAAGPVVGTVTITDNSTDASDTVGIIALPLVAGEAHPVSSTTTTATVVSAAASGGTTPYTYQWHRSTSSGFTPSGGTVVSGATSLSLTDTGLSVGTTYYYKLVTTDNAAVTATSTECPIRTDFVSGTPHAEMIGNVYASGVWKTGVWGSGV